MPLLRLLRPCHNLWTFEHWVIISHHSEMRFKSCREILQSHCRADIIFRVFLMQSGPATCLARAFSLVPKQALVHLHNTTFASNTVR